MGEGPYRVGPYRVGQKRRIAFCLGIYQVVLLIYQVFASHILSIEVVLVFSVIRSRYTE